MSPRVLNKKRDGIPFDAVYVGRPSIFGNPYHLARWDRERAIALHERFILDMPDWTWIQDELRGKDLVCNCAPKPCHADILLWIANLDPLI